MNKPILVIMAAGMGSRYGGLKQLDALGPNGEVILDYSLMDAHKAGFEKVVFIIKKEIEEDFRNIVLGRAQKLMEAKLAFQEVDKGIGELVIPSQRQKPWGTAHAVLSAKEEIDGPFMVINADDYYGEEAFKKMYQFLSQDKETFYGMVGYDVKNTLSKYGTVSRGVCEVSDDNKLLDIEEIVNLELKDNEVGYQKGDQWVPIDQDAQVSMNCWGFSHDFLDKMGEAFPTYLENVIKFNPAKGEVYLPTMVKDLLLEKGEDVIVLNSKDKWFGITYPEDRPQVIESLIKMHKEGKY